MPTLDLSSPALALWSAAALGFLTGIVPIGAAEATALAIGLVTPRWLSWTMGLAFTLAHVAAKIPWYGIGLRANSLSAGRQVRYVDRAKALLDARPQYGQGILMASAILSAPPFHLAAIAAGLVRLPVLQFVAICVTGRLLRFGVLVTAPTFLRQLFG